MANFQPLLAGFFQRAGRDAVAVFIRLWLIPFTEARNQIAGNARHQPGHADEPVGGHRQFALFGARKPLHVHPESSHRLTIRGCGQFHHPQPEHGSCDEIAQQCAIHFIPTFEAAQVGPIRGAFYEPRVVITHRALKIRIFILDGAQEGRQTPPFSFRQGFQQVEQEAARCQRLVGPFAFAYQAGNQAQLVEALTRLPGFGQPGQRLQARHFQEGFNLLWLGGCPAHNPGGFQKFLNHSGRHLHFGRFKTQPQRRQAGGGVVKNAVRSGNGLGIFFQCGQTPGGLYGFPRGFFATSVIN